MGNINISTNSTVRLGNIGNVREAAAGDQSSLAKAIGGSGKQVSSIGAQSWNLAMEMKEREDNTKVNDAMSALLIGSGKISDGILGDDTISPGEYQNKYQEGYDKLYGEVTKDLNSAQLEKMKMASSRVYTSSMVSLGHAAMQRTVAQEKASAANLCAAAKIRAINNPNEETIGFALGAFTDAQKDTVREIHALEEAGKTKEATALRDALRIKQTQTLDEILGERAMNQIKAAEDAGNEAALEELAKKDWRKSAYGIDPNDGQKKILSSYDRDLGREGFGDIAAHALKSQAETALRRVRSVKLEKAHNAAMETERQMFLKALPEDTDGVIARYNEEAETYAKLSEDKNLTAAARRSYANAAQSLRQSAAKVKHEVATQAQQSRFEFELANFEAGMDASGNELSYDDMQTRARDLLSDGKISTKQFHRLMAVQKKELNEEQKRFRDLVYADFPKLMPNITQRNGRFEFTPSKKVPSADKSTGYEVDVERGFWNDTEEAYSYGQFVRAMNAIFDLGKSKGMTAEEMKLRFDELTAQDQTKCVQRNIDEMINAIENAAKDRTRMNFSTSATEAYIKKNSK